MRAVQCEYCGADTLGVDHPAAGFRLFGTVAVPAATCAVPAITRTRAGALAWANTVPDATEVYPLHRCPQWEEARIDRELAALTPRRDAEAYMVLQPPPSRTAQPHRRRNTA